MATRRAFLALLTAALLLASAAPLWAQPAAKPAALVNGEAISHAEVKAVLDARPSPVPLTEAQKRELRLSALEMLIDDVLMRQFLRKHAPAVAPSEIDKEIAELKEVLKKQNKTLLDFLREGQQTEAQLRGDIAARLQWKTYLTTRYPDTELQSYYEANKVFFDKVFVQASHILVKVDAAAPAPVRQKSLEKLTYLRQEILAGKLSFEDAAGKYSDCPSKTKGGDIGLFPYKFVVVDAFAKAAFSMKVGQISDIVTSDFGLHLIKVTNRTQGEPTTFETVKHTVREVLAQEQDLYERIIGEQRKNSKIEVFLQ